MAGVATRHRRNNFRMTVPYTDEYLKTGAFTWIVKAYRTHTWRAKLEKAIVQGIYQPNSAQIDSQAFGI